MISTWVVRTLLASVSFAAAAVLAEQIAAFFGKPRRWIWAVAMSASLLAPIAARLAPGVMPALGIERAPTPMRVSTGASTATTAVAPLSYDRGSVSENRPAPARGPTGLAWIVCSLTLMTATLVVVRRLLALRDDAAPIELDGMSVRATETFGPAVVGYRTPTVLIPRWVVNAPSGERRLILRHEREHIVGGDHWLFAFAATLVVAMPWNLVLWWQHLRLRLAIETDCDARVLGQGADRRAYGHALIRAVRTAHPMTFLSLAWGHRKTDLERRIRAMTAPPARARAVLTVPLLLMAVLLVVLACDATESDVTRVTRPASPDSATAHSALDPTPRPPTFYGLPGEGYVRVIGHTREQMPARIRVVSVQGPMRIAMGETTLLADSVFEVNFVTPRTFRIVGSTRYRVVAHAVDPGTEVVIEATAPKGFGSPRAASAQGPAPEVNFTKDPSRAFPMPDLRVVIPGPSLPLKIQLDDVRRDVGETARAIATAANELREVARELPQALPDLSQQVRDTANLEPGTILVWSASGRAERVIVTTDDAVRLIKAGAIWSSKPRAEGGNVIEIDTPAELHISQSPRFIARFDAVNPAAILESTARGRDGMFGGLGGHYGGGFAICGSGGVSGIRGPIQGPVTDARSCVR